MNIRSDRSVTGIRIPEVLSYKSSAHQAELFIGTENPVFSFLHTVDEQASNTTGPLLIFPNIIICLVRNIKKIITISNRFTRFCLLQRVFRSYPVGYPVRIRETRPCLQLSVIDSASVSRFPPPLRSSERRLLPGRERGKSLV